MNNLTKSTNLDVYMGRPANGLIWSGTGTGNDNPPTDDIFYIKNGRKFLRSSAYLHKTSHEKDRPTPFYKTSYNNVDYAITEDGETDIFSWETSVGNLIGKRQNNHFCEYPIKTIKDIDTWIHVFKNINFSKNEEWFNRHNVTKLSNFGLKWSPVQQLIQFDMGLENFYFFLVDAPEKMQCLLEVMQERCMDRLRLALSLSSSNLSHVYWGENTSSVATPCHYYEKLTLPHIKAYAKLIHKHKSRLIVHMCGALDGLLDCFLETGMDGINSATPPPFGDMPYSVLREKFQPDFTIHGRFNAQLWVGKSKQEIQNNIKQEIYPELLYTPFCLMVTDDAMSDIPYDDVMNLYDALETIKW